MGYKAGTDQNVYTPSYSILVLNTLQILFGLLFLFFLLWVCCQLQGSYMNGRHCVRKKIKNKTRFFQWPFPLMQQKTGLLPTLYEWKHIAVTKAERSTEYMKRWQSCGTLSFQQCSLDARFKEGLASSGEGRRENAGALSLKGFVSNC